MDHDAIIAKALDFLPWVRDFQKLFPSAEHVVVQSKRESDSEGWKPVHEWISRSALHDRYVVWLVCAIEIGADESLSVIESPEVFVVEAVKVVKSRDDEDGPLWDANWAELEAGDWEQLVESGGDFAAIGLEVKTDAHVERFATFWRDTRPSPNAEPPEAIAFKAPLRYIM